MLMFHRLMDFGSAVSLGWVSQRGRVEVHDRLEENG